MSTAKVAEIYNYLSLSDSIGTGGQPTVEQFAELKQAGYEVVVNLALSTSTNAIPDEAEIVASQGMGYVHIPVEWENPTLEDIQRFFATLQANADRRVFVHCAMNMRVSAFMYLYRRLQQQIDEDAARRNLEEIWTPNPTWERFIAQVLEFYI
ncbi:protein tyrosine phosphatase family protein [Desertifilum sp. FACHB-1129]|uniref:Phosphatase n=1 Tax=Desertifilum tharense IPPAS B-1220 TaxID=1781255 RepID=A0A1E5QCG2_9CYAN|nr:MULTISPECIES: protein tyrosine phosphatase family protein [Desertifilum]MDA0210846.1 protein tyrosine phosphatase family protein [Cyanobacteria bacterium FC1]MBD2312079.1 protein tyrosine phosphatase family protein [Desertifilum sp. FACHB-1129]MBD2322260.1 protein tyrosine phosphatase family protein [Desertifilum sp. FACHB-866]MBD2332297.1 protein tyrosine phosphatase family protein [Desertifilum sp. FACHB-868]OEJ72345.1 phosphatase [Desertifilum tharense IPPAS B-1220]